MTVKELIDFLETVKDKEQIVYTIDVSNNILSGDGYEIVSAMEVKSSKDGVSGVFIVSD